MGTSGGGSLRVSGKAAHQHTSTPAALLPLHLHCDSAILCPALCASSLPTGHLHAAPVPRLCPTLSYPAQRMVMNLTPRSASTSTTWCRKEGRGAGGQAGWRVDWRAGVKVPLGTVQRLE